MKIKYDDFIKNCTDLEHRWMSDYSTDFFKCFFSWVNTIGDKTIFGNIINDYQNNKFCCNHNKNHKNSIVIEFTIYQNGEFNIESTVRGWSIRNKKVQMENIDFLLSLYSKYINELYKSIYNKNLFFKEEN